MSECAHVHEIVGVNDRHGDVLLRCTHPGCHRRRRVKASALRREDVTAESLAVWRPYLRREDVTAESLAVWRPYLRTAGR